MPVTQGAHPMNQTDRPRPSQTMRVGAAILGNALEFYDFTVYAAFAVWLAKAFFPADNPNIEPAADGRDLWRRLRGAPARRHPDRRLCRSLRPQARDDADHLADGAGHRHDRPAADLRPDRIAGAGPAGARATVAGFFDRRRDGAGDDLSAGERACAPQRLLRKLAARQPESGQPVLCAGRPWPGFPDHARRQ